MYVVGNKSDVRMCVGKLESKATNPGVHFLIYIENHIALFTPVNPTGQF